MRVQTAPRRTPSGQGVAGGQPVSTFPWLLLDVRTSHVAIALSVGTVALLLLSAFGAVGGPTSPARPGTLGSDPGAGPARPASSSAPGTPLSPTIPRGTSPNPTAAPALATAGGREGQTLAAIEGAGVPLRYAFLPNLNADPTTRSVGGHVALPYTTAPAPFGLADFGLINRSGVLVPQDLTTSRVKGTFAPSGFSGLAMDTGSPDYYGVQLNAVLQNVTLFGNSSYSFWTQNVLEYSTASHELTFLDNLWNFSSFTTSLSSNAIAAHGENGTQVGTTYYYAVGPTISIGYPFTVSLLLSASAEGGRDYVFFNYSISNESTTRSGSYDFVAFNSGGDVPTPPVYVANGYSDNALGLPNDFELTVGGPGGGSNFDAFNASAAENLYYWDSTLGGFRVVPSAEDVGGDTGETAVGLSSTWAPGEDLPLGGTSGPAGHLSQGPALVQGEWNVTNSTQGATTVHLGLAPHNGFAFLAAGTGPAPSAYQWAPPNGPYLIPPGSYSLTALASDFDPQSEPVVVAGAATWVNVTLVSDPGTGVYAPLWALSSNGLTNISSNCAGGNCTLLNDQSGALGQPADLARAYSWFGIFNDYFYPEFAGVLLWNISHVWVTNPPSLEASTPPWLANQTQYFGTPTTNDLPIVFYDDSNVRLSGGAAIGGWSFSGAYFGPAGAQSSVVLWNTTDSLVANNTFLTSAEGLYLYGGTNNTIVGNTFLNYYPIATNPGSISGEVVGTTGIYEADFGNGRVATSGCDCGDLAYNNAVGTYRTAIEPTTDPYTGGAPRLPFETLWNITPRPGSNIAGGNELGGNYWWDYGASTNPYWVLPYNASGGIPVGGDFHPLVSARLWTVTFEEQGLPVGTAWQVGIDTSTGTALNRSTGTSLTEEWPSGYYYLTADSIGGVYGIANSEVLDVGLQNFTDILQFYPLYSLTFQAVNLPNDGFWVVTFTNATIGSWIDLGNVPQFPAQTLASGWYNFTVTAPAGYTAAPDGGKVDMDTNRTITIEMSEVGAPGRLSGSVTPGTGATLWVDNQSVPIDASGTFSLTVPAGLHSVRVMELGYVPYFNNVTVNGGGTTSLSIVLIPAPGGSGSGAPSNTELVQAAVALGVLAVVLAITTIVFYQKSRPPPPRSG